MVCVNDFCDETGEAPISCIECAWYYPDIALAEIEFGRLVSVINTMSPDDLERAVDEVFKQREVEP